MSLKPEVVRVSGVHSVTNSSQEGDIGFPQLQLEKLFEAATVKELESGAEYTEGKKYAYLNPNWPGTDPNKYLSIENKAHFYCVRDGYCGLDGSADHYYTKVGDDYKYNAVPPTGSWEAKLEFSDAIKDKKLYSIENEIETMICDLNTISFYKKEKNGDYKKQDRAAYEVYRPDDTALIMTDHEYACEFAITIDEEGNAIGTVFTWKDSNGDYPSGYSYLYVEPMGSGQFAAQFVTPYFNNEGVWIGNFDSMGNTIYYDSENHSPTVGLLYPTGLPDSEFYVKSGNKFYPIIHRASERIIFNENPIEAIDGFYARDSEPWLYPCADYESHRPSRGCILVDSEGKLHNYNSEDFPIYYGTRPIEIKQNKNDPYTVYEKLAVTVNYKYSGNNNLKFIFTDKSVPEVLADCNLSSTLSKYVHLTNLEYTTDMA